MSYAEDFSADLAQAGNLNFRLAELLEQHGTRAVLGALATACESAAEGPGAGWAARVTREHEWGLAANKLRRVALGLKKAEERTGATLEDACRVLADVELSK